ncbi:MAG TPA: cytochrome c [Candidatus Nitrosotalea sp.]|nr:cytochrome c [Candidatus Nitrosotalea sp.]
MIGQRRWRIPAALAVAVPLILAGWTLTAVFAAGSSTALPGDPTHGASVFSQNCTACHGANLEGGVGPRLNPLTQLPGVKNPKDPNYLITTVTNGRSGDPGYSAAMPKFGGTLSPQDIKDVVSFILQQNESGGAAALTPEDLARSTVFWITVSVLMMVFLTYLLSRYNMRWIARRAAERGETGRRS